MALTNRQLAIQEQRIAPVEKSFCGFLREVRHGDPVEIAKQGGRYVAFEKANDTLSGAAGGYLTPTEFTLELLKPLAERSLIYKNAHVIKMNSGTARGPMLMATASHAAGITPFFSGLTFGWGPGATFATAETEPVFAEQVLNAHDLTGYGVISNQMLDDAGPEGDARLIDIIGQAAAWYAEYAFFNGLGAGSSMPLGMLNAPCAYNVNRAGAGTVALADTANMIGHLLPMSWESSFWVCSPSTLSKVVQISGYQASTGSRIDGNDCSGYLQNRELYVSEKLPALGTRGDLILIDPSLYVIGDRLQVVVDVCRDEPTQFTKNRSMYRVWLRLDGKPMLNGTVTLADAATVASSVVVLN